ncbi:MAG TPA: GyrI-like domain-containing protein [Chloroflexi bacterium]|jgi:predicted transcriptional regulator YdeE|nr:GyrI-like domain-containing protein [Chloroflexota bacterium]
MPAELVEFTVKTLGPVKVVGKELRARFVSFEDNPIPAFWDRCFEDGTIAALEALPGRCYPSVYIGWEGAFTPDDQIFSYVVGVLAAPGAAVPEGMVAYDIPENRFAVGAIRGTPPDIYARAHDLTCEQAAKAGLEPALDFEMEWYDERFMQPDGQRLIDLYIPVE